MCVRAEKYPKSTFLSEREGEMHGNHPFQSHFPCQTRLCSRWVRSPKLIQFMVHVHVFWLVTPTWYTNWLYCLFFMVIFGFKPNLAWMNLPVIFPMIDGSAFVNLCGKKTSADFFVLKSYEFFGCSWYVAAIPKPMHLHLSILPPNFPGVNPRLALELQVKLPQIYPFSSAIVMVFTNITSMTPPHPMKSWLVFLGGILNSGLGNESPHITGYFSWKNPPKKQPRVFFIAPVFNMFDPSLCCYASFLSASSKLQVLNPPPLHQVTLQALRAAQSKS